VNLGLKTVAKPLTNTGLGNPLGDPLKR